MKKMCIEPGCGRLFEGGRGYRCPDHRSKTLKGAAWRDRASQSKFRKAVLEAAGYQCQAVVHGVRCTVTGATNLQAHHLRSETYDPAAGAALCKAHHRLADDARLGRT